MHESTRKRNPEFMADVYDTPRWRALMGEPTEELTRISAHYCVDAIPAHAKKDGESVKPLQLLFLSFPPWLRYQARYMLVQALIPARLKGKLIVVVH